MGLSLVLGPTVEPLSLAEAKARVRVDSTVDDAVLTGYIFTARRYAENYIRGAMITQTHDFTVDWGWPYVCANGYLQKRIELPLHPVQSVTSVSYVDENGATQTLSSSLYTLHKDGPVPYIAPAYDASWPTVRNVPAAITVRFVCGYTPETLPDELRTAIMLHVESLFDSCDDKGACEKCRDSLLDPYRVLRVA